MRRGRAGQQLTEFTLVVGMVAIVAIAMQLRVRRGVCLGIGNVSNLVLGKPLPAGSFRKNQGPYEVKSQESANEQGTATFLRVTDTNDAVGGTAANHSAQLQYIPDVGAPIRSPLPPALQGVQQVQHVQGQLYRVPRTSGDD